MFLASKYLSVLLWGEGREDGARVLVHVHQHIAIRDVTIPFWREQEQATVEFRQTSHVVFKLTCTCTLQLL